MAKFDNNDKVCILDSTLTKINDGTVIDCVSLPWGEQYSVKLANGRTQTFSESSLSRPDDMRLPADAERGIDAPRPLFMRHQFVDSRNAMMGRGRNMRIVGVLREPDGSFRYEVLRAETPNKKIYKEAALIPGKKCH